MIAQLRVFKLLCEFVWVKGLLVGFSLPQEDIPYFGLNLGFVCVLVSRILYPQDCDYCERPLNWGLHGKLGPWRLCKPRDCHL